MKSNQETDTTASPPSISFADVNRPPFLYDGLRELARRTAEVKLSEHSGQVLLLEVDSAKDTLPFLSHRSEPGATVVPLFIEQTPGARQKCEKTGLRIPGEFLLEGENRRDNGLLIHRAKQLVAMFPTGLPDDLVRAMYVGYFRNWMFLDDDHHQSCQLDCSAPKRFDLTDWNGDWSHEGTPWPEKIGASLREMRAGQHTQSLLKLFRNEEEAIEDVFARISEFQAKKQKEILERENTRQRKPARRRASKRVSAS